MSGTPEDATGVARETFGPYALHERLGRGAMGEVHRAHDTVRDRFVALKRLTPELAGDEGIQERFRRESQVAARLASPHVIPIHDYGVIDGRLFIDMRLVDGQDLQRLLAAEGRLSPERAVTIVTQLASALDAAHADGLVHRDVKPSNTLVTTHRDQDFVYLVDFGIVRLASGTAAQITRTGTSLGTVAYMAPEAIEGAVVDARADVYALAVVLFETLTGSVPFTGEIPSVLYAHVNTTAPTPSSVRPDLPSGFDLVLRGGLAKDPAQRFSTAGALADAAREALATSPSGPVPPATPATLGSAVTVPSAYASPADALSSAGARGPSGTRAAVAPPRPVAPGDVTAAPAGWGGGPSASPSWSGFSGYSSSPGFPSSPDDVFRRAPATTTPYPGSPHGSLPGPLPAPAPPGRRRRGLLVGLVAAALVLVAVAVVVVVAVRPGPPLPPRVVTTSMASVPLTTAIPVSDAPGCDRFTPNDGIWINSGNVPAEEVRTCAVGPAHVVYARWPSTGDADTYFRQWAAAPSTDGSQTWSNPRGGPVQGPYHQSIATDGSCTTILSWTGLRQMGEVFAPTCPQADNALTTDRVPTLADLQTITATIPGATAAGCGASTPTPGATGTTPLETRTCTVGAATVRYDRWNAPADAGAELRARQAGLDPSGSPMAWTTTSGVRQGPFARVEQGGGCTESLAYDTASYSIQVQAADCTAADAAVAALAPPDATRLPH